ncbi:hypothetical protein AALB16_08230 [Lachnospiraceae bacterium 62-35]
MVHRIPKITYCRALEYLFLYVTLAYWLIEATNIVVIRGIQSTILSILLYRRQKKLPKNNLYLTSLILGSALLTIMLKSSYFKIDISMFSAVFVSVLLMSAIGWNEFCIVFLNFMYFISCFSLCTFVLYLIIPSVFFALPIVHATAETANVFFSLVPLYMNDYYRNFGCFTEPGVFQIYLNLALLIGLFINKITVKKTAIFCITIITTFSTAGYFSLFTIIAAYFFNKTDSKADRKLKKYIASISVFGVLLIAYLFVKGYLDNYLYVFTKLSELAKEGSTANVRFKAFTLGLARFKDNLILGCGWGEWIELYLLGNNLTCTQINYFAIYGLFVGGIFNLAYVYWAQSLCKLRIAKAFLVLAVEMLLFSQDLVGNEVWTLIMFCSYERMIFHTQRIQRASAVKLENC